MPKPASISGANGNDLRGKRILVAGIKGPAGFPAQFLPDTPPFKTLEDICKWFADLFHTGVLIPGGDRRVIDIDLAATSPTYCDSSGPSLLVSDVAAAEVPAYLAGQVLAIHPAYDTCFASFHRHGDGHMDQRRLQGTHFSLAAAPRLRIYDGGVFGGYQPWNKRTGRLRSLGDGQVSFKRFFSLLAEIGFDGWAVPEWECCVTSPEQGAREGSAFTPIREAVPEWSFAEVATALQAMRGIDLVAAVTVLAKSVICPAFKTRAS